MRLGDIHGVQKERAVLIVVGLIITFALSAAVSYWLIDLLNKSEPRPDRPRYSWKKRVEIKGKKAGETERFRIRHAPWRLRWKVEGRGPTTSVGLTIMPTATERQPVFEQTGIGADSAGSTVINDSGEYYVIVSSLGGKWKLIAEAYEPINRVEEPRHRAPYFWERLLGKKYRAPRSNMLK